MKNEFPNLGSVAKLALFGFAVLAFFIYLPAFVTPFGIHNDYCFLGYRLSGSWFCFPESMHLMALGRPLGAALLNAHGLFLRSLESFGPARLLSFAVSLGSAWLVVRYLVDRLQVDAVLAAAVGFCLLLLPGSQLYILWLTNFVPGALNTFFALCCYRLLDMVEPLDLLRGNRRALGLASGAIGIFFLTLCIYPPTALAFLVLTFARILFSPIGDWPQVRLKVIRDLVFAGAGMIVYFVVNKIVLLPLFSAWGSETYLNTLAHINQAGTYRFELATNLTDKMDEFAYISTIAIGGGLHAILGDVSGWIMAGLTVAAFVFVAVRAVQVPGAAGNLAWIAQRCALGVLIILCASSPSLAASKGEVGYRVLTTYEFIALLCLFAPLHWLSRLAQAFPVRSSAVALALLSGWLAGWNVSDVARNANRELLFIREKLESVDKSKLSTVIGIARPRGVSYIERTLQLEFAFPIDHITHFAGAVEGLLSAVGMGDRQLTYTCDEGRQRVTFRQSDAIGADLPPLVVQSQGDGLMLVDDQTLLINLNEARVSGPSVAAPLASVRTSGSGGRTLFDSTSPVYWKAGPAPQWLELNLAAEVAFKQITFFAGPDAAAAGEMPKDWRVMASDDEVNWIEIDSRSGQDKWKAGEGLKFQFKRSVNASHYLIVFTAGNGPTLKLFKIGL